MNKKTIIGKMSILLIIFITALLLETNAAPPTPHNIKGTIYDINSQYISELVTITINNTNNSEFITTENNGNGPPQVFAAYAESMQGADGDFIIVKAWNATHYGINTTYLASTTTYANVILNYSRPSETNVTILAPRNDSLYNISGTFNVTARISIIAADGIDCFATIIFSDQEVLKITSPDSKTHSLSNIPLGTFKTATWNITANNTGSSNITVTANCTSDGDNFENLDSFSVYNISVEDKVPPIVQLMYPKNNSIITVASSPINFQYNVSDASKISNCSIIINNIINKTNYSISRDTMQQFDVLMSQGIYNWSVSCVDNSSNHNTGASGTFNLSLIPNYPPTISSLTVNSPIDLNAGSTTTIYCNATVTDLNNRSDIGDVNSTFFYNTSASDAADDNNYHYSNSSCKIVSQNEFSIDYSCSYKLQYYANSGNWTCNISAKDSFNETGSGSINTEINQLLAIDISPSIIDYGQLEPGQNSISTDKINITNIGNIDFNVTLEGFAKFQGDNLSMNCSDDNISIGFEKYSINDSTSYPLMTNLTSSPVKLINLPLPRRTNDTTYKSDRNYTYWRMGIPEGIKGICSGFITFAGVTQ